MLKMMLRQQEVHCFVSDSTDRSTQRSVSVPWGLLVSPTRSSSSSRSRVLVQGQSSRLWELLLAVCSDWMLHFLFPPPGGSEFPPEDVGKSPALNVFTFVEPGRGGVVGGEGEGGLGQ